MGGCEGEARDGHVEPVVTTHRRLGTEFPIPYPLVECFNHPYEDPVTYGEVLLPYTSSLI